LFLSNFTWETSQFGVRSVNT